MGECLCDRCAGLCCRYFALPIDNPKEQRDYDNIRWYLLHENVTVFVEKKQWYIGIANRCKALQPDNRCGVYRTRPKVCRSYSTDSCDWHGGEYNFESLFTSATQLEAYAKQKLSEQRAKQRKLDAKAKVGRASKRRKPQNAPSRPRKNLKRLSEALERTVEAQKRATVGQAGEGGRSISLPLLKR